MDSLYDDIDFASDSTRPTEEQQASISKEENPAGTSECGVVVDKRCYSYFCKFMKSKLDKIRKGCSLIIDNRQGVRSDSTEIEIRFAKARAGSTCAEWQQRFIELYAQLTTQLVVERVVLADVDNLNKMLNKMRSYAPSLAIKGDGTVDIVCEREALEGIRYIVNKYVTKKAKLRLTLPVGYDINGAFRLYLYLADIIKLNVEAIFIVTDDSLRHDSEVGKAIARAAGPELEKASREQLSKSKFNRSAVFSTTAGNLPCNVVLHAVGPSWPEGCDNDTKTNVYRRQLTEAIENLLATADKQRYKTVALSAISLGGSCDTQTGVVAKALKDAILKASLLCHRSKLEEIHIVDEEEEAVMLLMSELADGGRFKTTNGKNVNITLLPEKELQNVGMAVTTDMPAEYDYAQVVKRHPDIFEVKPTLPKKEPQTQQIRNTNVGKVRNVYENVSPPVPVKNEQLLEELKCITASLGENDRQQRSPKVSTSGVTTPSHNKYSHRATQNAGTEATRSNYELARPLQFPYETVESSRDRLRKNSKSELGPTAANPIKFDNAPTATPAVFQHHLSMADEGDISELRASSDEDAESYLYDEVIVVDGTKAKVIEDRVDDGSWIAVDGRYYRYLCKFRRKEIVAIQKACHLDEKSARDIKPNVLELQFAQIGPAGPCAESQQQFAEKYENLKRELVVEEVALAEVENVNKMLTKIRSHSQTLVTKHDDTVSIVCKREALVGVRNIIGKFTVTRKTKPSPTLPVGYDMNGAFRLYLYAADVTKLNVDAIVDVTDELLRRDSQTSKQIDEAAGPELGKSSRESIDKMNEKRWQVFSTPAGKLPCKVVLHALVPTWPKGANNQKIDSYKTKLRETLEYILTTADRDHSSSVAIPIDDSGTIFAPVPVVVQALREALLNSSSKRQKSKLKEVHVVNRTEAVISQLMAELGNEAIRKTPEGHQVKVHPLTEAETYKAIDGRMKGNANPPKGKFKWFSKPKA